MSASGPSGPLVCTTLFPYFHHIYLQNSSRKHAFSIRVENRVDPSEIYSIFKKNQTGFSLIKAIILSLGKGLHKLTLKAPRKKTQLKMSSAEVVCCK